MTEEEKKATPTDKAEKTEEVKPEAPAQAEPAVTEDVEEPVLKETDEDKETPLSDEEKAKLDEKKLKEHVRTTARFQRPSREQQKEEKLREWEPKTKLGKLVKTGQITSMHDALNSGFPIREVEIVDLLLPELEDEVLDVNMVQRMTDSGRRVRFAITTVVGNGDGYVGVGVTKGKEVGPAIRKSIDNAKINILELRRGCGSWECGCKEPHSFPFQVKGKCSSVVVILKPAPKGVSLAVSEVPRKILKLAGIKDCWAITKGQTRTTINYAKAVFDALQQLNRTRVNKTQMDDFKIAEGQIGGIEE
jgi:small subunit ribosomal protein S5